jgi:hypothetical protein
MKIIELWRQNILTLWRRWCIIESIETKNKLIKRSGKMTMRKKYCEYCGKPLDVRCDCKDVIASSQ